MAWIRVESKSRAGKYYYYHRESKASTWKMPPDYKHPEERSKVISTESAVAPTHLKPSTNTSSAGTHQTGTSHQSKTEDVRQRRNMQGNLQTNANNNCMESASTIVGREAVQPEGDEAMETERWGDEEEIGMDVDMTEEEQLALITEINSTRNHLTLASSLESFGDHTTEPLPLVHSEKLYLVLDTNILLSHLGFLAELKDCAIKAVGRPLLVIPWVVMQELDALKTRNNPTLADKARRAIRFLHQCFESHHPRVRGQTMEEVQTEVRNIAISNNDDRILHCCLLYQERVKGHGGVAVLFSNDVQLCSKAMVNNIRALNRKTLLSELRILCKSSSAATSYTQTQEYASRVAQKMTFNPRVVEKQVPTKRAVMDDLLCESEALVRDALAAVIAKEMKDAYGADLWEEIVAIKPPWTLKDVVYLLEKHWVAVFRIVVALYHKNTNIQKLLKHTACRASMVPTVTDVQTFQFHSMELLRAFAQESDYGGVLPYSIAGLSVLADKFTEEGKSPSVTRRVTPPVMPPVYHVTSPPNHVTVPLITSLLTPSCDEIIRLSGAIPQPPLDQLQWILNVVMGVTKHCHSRIILAVQNTPHSVSDRQESSIFLSQLLELLTATTSAINNLLVNGSSVPHMRDMLGSLDVFLQTSLRKNSPLTLDNFVVCVQTLGVKVQHMLQEALMTYRGMLEILQDLGRQLGL